MEAAAGWGEFPRTGAMYVIASVDRNDGETNYVLRAKDVAVDAFWSVTVYNAAGYLEANSLGVTSYNDVTTEPNPDTSITVHFGGCEDGERTASRSRRDGTTPCACSAPREEILEGTWTFPQPAPVGG